MNISMLVYIKSHIIHRTIVQSDVVVVHVVFRLEVLKVGFALVAFKIQEH